MGMHVQAAESMHDNGGTHADVILVALPGTCTTQELAGAGGAAHSGSPVSCEPKSQNSSEIADGCFA